MALTSLRFLVFVLALLVVYFAVPGRWQWLVLLAASLIFYAMAGPVNLIFLAVTALSAWAGTLVLDRLSQRQKELLKAGKETLSREEKAAVKARFLRKRRWVLAGILILNFGLLCVFKYAHFALAQADALSRLFGGPGVTDSLSLAVPLGISFYTFQTMGYAVDVYWSKVPAERNPARLLLFTSFFPQITQGPISDYRQLEGQLREPHRFTYEQYALGGQRMIWGFFKKLVVADLLAPYVQDVFRNYSSYAGITVLLGALFYSIQIYADFSGYMDIVCGLCQMLGISLTENFERPYFSKSIAEYWRRWHISLGAWFKTYIYYPIAVAKWNTRLGKAAQKKLGRAVGRNLPASLALVAVWFTTGLWHGASWGYIAWGGVNGLFIIFSMWMEPVYDRWKQRLHIRQSAWLWRAFQVLRTFLLVTFIKVLPEVGGLRAGLGLWKQIFTEHTLPRSLGTLLPFASGWTLLLIGIGTALMLTVSLLQRTGSVRVRLNRLPLGIRLVILAALIAVTVAFGSLAVGGGGGFMYAQF